MNPHFNSISSFSTMPESQPQQQMIATSGAALQTFSSLFSSSPNSHNILDNSHRSIDDNSSALRGPPRRYPTRRPPVATVSDEEGRASSSSLSSSSCRESYRLFKKCSMARETEGFSCSDAVASYMRCALNEGC